MWPRVVSSCVVMLLYGCAGKREEKKSAAPPTRVVAIDAAVPSPPIARSAPAAIDAAPASAPRATPPTPTTPYIEGGYLSLLYLDYYFGEVLGNYPGAPPTNRYMSFKYKWETKVLDELEAGLRIANATAELRQGNDATSTDRAVGAYTRQVLAVWPELRALVDYYQLRLYVDDEFARGRRDGQIVADAVAKIGPLRTPMIESVFDGWRVAAGDKPASARAIASGSFEACTRAAHLVFAIHARMRAKTLQPEDAEARAAIDTKMSACRRGVGAVSVLPEGFHSFATALRNAAVAFGDAADADWSIKYAGDDLERLVEKYIVEWPKLPAEPAEQAPP